MFWHSILRLLHQNPFGRIRLYWIAPLQSQFGFLQTWLSCNRCILFELTLRFCFAFFVDRCLICLCTAWICKRQLCDTFWHICDELPLEICNFHENESDRSLFTRRKKMSCSDWKETKDRVEIKCPTDFIRLCIAVVLLVCWSVHNNRKYR